MKRKFLLSTFCIFLFANFLSAQTWDGSASTDWNTPANWSTNAVPTATDNVIIPASLATYPRFASNVTINSINMQAGSQVDVNGFTLTLNGISAYIYFTGATLNNSIVSTDIVVNINTGGGGFLTYFRSNTVNDNITFNLTGTNQFNEADIASSANTYNGNASFNINGSLPFYLSYLSTSNFKGNLTVNRTIAGTTHLFNGGAAITGNFSYTNNTSGITTLGNTTIATNIAGKVNILANYTTNNTFTIYRLINQATGGSINIQNTTGFDFRNDTLKVTSLSVTGYKTGQYGYFLNNAITGNVTIADDATYSGGFLTQIRNNIVTGTSSFTNNGTNVLYDADAVNTGNTYNGNTSYTATNSGGIQVSNGSASNFNGNLIITRTSPGPTQFFNAGAAITGNFSYTNNAAGVSTFGNTAFATNIGGTVNIAASYTTNNTFAIYRLINQTTGGSINIQNTTGFDIQKDTLKVTSLSVTGYKTGQYGYFLNNAITGNVTIADDATYSGGFLTQIRNNIITGNSSFTNNGTNELYEADAANTGNTYNGNTSYTATNSGGLRVSNGSASNFNANLTITRTASGPTQFFNSGAAITGNFSYTNNTAGLSTFGSTAFATNIGGTVNIAASYTTNNTFAIYRLINQTTGGSINIQNTTGFDIQKDTLKVTSLSVTGYKTGQYGYFLNNAITGNITIADDATYGGGFLTQIRNNIVTGNSSFTNNGSNILYDADAANTGNKYIGNVAYAKNGSGVITVAAGSIDEITQNLTLNSTAGITLGKIKFNGGTNGIVTQLGTQAIIISEPTMEKTGTGNVTLNDSVTVSNVLALTRGIILSSITNNLIFPDNVTYTGGSDLSYVDGPMLKTGNDAFVFPLGQNNVFAPISITAPANVADQFRGQYTADVPNNAGYDSTKRDPSLNHISSKEYWLLDRTVGTSNVKVTLSWDKNRSGVVNDMPNLRVARWNGSIWKDEGNGATTGNNMQGTVQSLNAVTSFSPFTLASTNALNPLPITLLNFIAQKCDDNVCLQWSTENEKNSSHFEIERANGDNDFKLTGSVYANNNPVLNKYAFSDKAPGTSVNFYRLKIVDADGSFTYSKVLPVIFNSITSTLIYPNPARDEIKILSSKNIISIEISDLSGRLIKAMRANSTNRYSISELQKGLYIVKISGNDDTIVSKKLIVE